MVLMLFSSSKSSVAGGNEPKIQGKSFFQSSFRGFRRNFPIGPYCYPHKAHIHVKTFIKIKIFYRSHFKISCNLKHTYFLKGLTNWVSLLCPLNMIIVGASLSQDMRKPAFSYVNNKDAIKRTGFDVHYLGSTISEVSYFQKCHASS